MLKWYSSGPITPVVKKDHNHQFEVNGYTFKESKSGISIFPPFSIGVILKGEHLPKRGLFLKGGI